MTVARQFLTTVVLCALAWGTVGTSSSAAIHNVFVGDNFFSPAVLTIDSGDTVRWTNAAGVHNVFSCTATQLGCDGAIANETFDNGPPRVGLWVFSYTFTQPGSNPYLCQSHASFMHGEIVVNAPTDGPPAVPDGTIGLPMTAGKTDEEGTAVTIGWDTESCGPAARYRILHGTEASYPSGALDPYETSGGICDVSQPFVWSSAPVSPGSLVWWIVVADDGGEIEGSWGAGAFGERRGPLDDGASGQCGATSKVVAVCAP